MSLKVISLNDDQNNMDDSFDLGSFQLKEHFKSKKEVLSQDRIYVYCPPELAKSIGIIVEDYSFDIVVNDYTVTDFTKKSDLSLSK